jgi:membrane protein CcdC involved in cytochrome C biogenesis
LSGPLPNSVEVASAIEVASATESRQRKPGIRSWIMTVKAKAAVRQVSAMDVIMKPALAILVALAIVLTLAPQRAHAGGKHVAGIIAGGIIAGAIIHHANKHRHRNYYPHYKRVKVYRPVIVVPVPVVRVKLHRHHWRKHHRHW